MKVSELIYQLGKIDPDLELCCEVNDDFTNEGRYLDIDSLEIIEVYPYIYGGYQSCQVWKPNEEQKAQVRKVVVIG